MHPTHELILKIMTELAFYDVSHALNWDIDSSDTKNQVESLLVILNKNFQKYFICSSYVVIDEALKKMKIKKSKISVAIHSKPARKGTKYLVLADKNYYSYNITLYLGESTTNMETIKSFMQTLPTGDTEVFLFLLILGRYEEQFKVKFLGNLKRYISYFIRPYFFLTLDSGFGSQDCAVLLNKSKIRFVQAMKPSKDYGIYCKKLDEILLEKGEWASCVIPGLTSSFSSSF